MSRSAIMFHIVRQFGYLLFVAVHQVQLEYVVFLFQFHMVSDLTVTVFMSVLILLRSVCPEFNFSSFILFFQEVLGKHGIRLYGIWTCSTAARKSGKLLSLYGV